MIYCNDCGQCMHIDNEPFVEFCNTSGWETRYLDPETGDVTDYGDAEITDCISDYTECPHCENNNIEFGSDVSEEDAFKQRAEYEENMKKLREQQKRKQVNARTRNSEWDHSVNPI